MEHLFVKPVRCRNGPAACRDGRADGSAFHLPRGSIPASRIAKASHFFDIDGLESFRKRTVVLPESVEFELLARTVPTSGQFGKFLESGRVIIGQE